MAAEFATLDGWLPVTDVRAAVMALAEPSIAWATVLEGSANCAAIWLRDSPWRTCGEKLEPVTT